MSASGPPSFEKSRKIFNCHLLQIIGGALYVKSEYGVIMVLALI